jgi:cyanophycin synthetase
MEVLGITSFKGRNIYSHKPVMKMTIDITENNIYTKDIEGFNEKLLTAFPMLRKNTCGLGYEGGFLERLENGTYLGHVLEHVILDIQNTLGHNVKYGKTRLLKEPAVYYLVYEYENEILALECSKVAVFILNNFISGKEINVEKYLNYLWEIKSESDFGPSTAAIVQEAKNRKIPITRLGNDNLVRLGYGKYSKVIQATLTDATSCIATDITSDKQLTKSILIDQKIPVPFGKVVYTEVSAVMAAKSIGMPVVLKPFNGNQGKGVQTNLQNEEEVKKAFKKASKFSSGVLVEQYISGNDYRVLVVGDQVSAVSQRVSAMVIGDGVHTIEELIDIINSDPQRGEGHEKSLTKIKLDDIALDILNRNRLNLNYIPAKNERVLLRENGNISTGGTAIDCTEMIHPENAEIAVRAAEALGINIAGVDIVTEDITKPILETGGAVIEVNSAPGLRMHLYPSGGKPRNVAKDIIDLLFPNDQETELPIVSVTGTNGKTTTVRLINHVLSLSGRTVGMTSTSGTFIGDKCVCKGDNSGPNSAKALLSNKQIDAAVFETARGGIIREGLGYDLADIGVITNISEDHLGLNGIDTLEDMAHIKALVAEAVKPNGYAVLNAEDEMTNTILKSVQVKVILFYKNKNSIKVENSNDHIHVFVDDEMIKIKDSQKIIDVVNIKNIPITYNGLISCQIENSLAATAALYGLNIPIETIQEGLMSFKNNPGRFQLFQMNQYKILLDYAHNSAGYEEIGNLCKKIDHKRKIGIIGMPGDRPDSAIKQVGKISATSFDLIYIKEDIDLRNRQKNEVANLLCEGVLEGGLNKKNVLFFEEESTALEHAMQNAEENDLIVVLYENFEPLKNLINQNV